MFAIITPALITGAFADRIAFKSYLKFLVVWSLIVYVPIVHWIWGGGFLTKWGVEDFAGGMVVHTSAGFAALASVFVVGSRKFAAGEKTVPHNVAFVGLGTGLLWFGWFGFNAGSALAANAVAAQAFVNTDIAASVAMCTWLAVRWWRSGKPSIVGAFTGAVAGLACVTPVRRLRAHLGLLFHRPARWVDLLRGRRLRPPHEVGRRPRRLGRPRCRRPPRLHPGRGLRLRVGQCRRRATASSPATPALFGKQVAAAIFIAVYAFVVTWVILKVLDKFEPIRVPDAVELAGLDTELEEPDAYVFS